MACINTKNRVVYKLLEESNLLIQYKGQWDNGIIYTNGKLKFIRNKNEFFEKFEKITN